MGGSGFRLHGRLLLLLLLLLAWRLLQGTQAALGVQDAASSRAPSRGSAQACRAAGAPDGSCSAPCMVATSSMPPPDLHVSLTHQLAWPS